jgi:hypothetical protein
VEPAGVESNEQRTMSGEHGRARKRIANSRVEWPLSLLARLFGAVVCLSFCPRPVALVRLVEEIVSEGDN